MSKRRLSNAVTSAVQVKQRIDHINTKPSFIQQPIAKRMIPPSLNTRKPNHEAKPMN
jgi:hypothetical protein